jgi:hypothetical protein
MKQIVSNYSYSPATNVVTLTGVNIDADQLLLIVAPQVGRTLYNFASVTGTVSAGADTRVTLNASTAGLTTTSPLVIFYDDQASTQTVTGTVTANVGGIASGVTIPVRLFAEAEGGPSSGQDTLLNCDSAGQLLINAKAGGASVLGYDGNAFVSVKQVAGSSVTIGSLPAISGTVTVSNAVELAQALLDQSSSYASLDVNIGGVGSVTLPISGTVTANASNGSLTTRFGTPTTANVSFATSAVTNANRKYLLIQNVTTGSNVITVGIGFTPTTTQGIQLTAGAGITFESSYIPTGQIFVLSSVTASNFTILEA